MSAHEPARDTRRRVVFGFLASVEADADPVRACLVQGDDDAFDIPVNGALSDRIAEWAGQYVELHLRETLADGEVAERVIDGGKLLFQPGHADAPPKTIDELAREQGLDPRTPPDYAAILSGLFGSEEEAEAFRRRIRESRLLTP